MDDDTYLIGDQNFDADHKDFIILKTKKGQDITVALTASGVPFKGRLTSGSILFDYDTNYSSEVKEIIEKITSDNYADLRQEIREHRGKDELYFIPTVAKILHMTEGTLCRRPMDIQLAVCKRYADTWCCDSYTIQHELRDALMLITKPELTDSDKEKAVGKD